MDLAIGFDIVSLILQKRISYRELVSWSDHLKITPITMTYYQLSFVDQTLPLFTRL